MESPLFLLDPQHGKDLQGPVHGLEGHLQCLGKLRQDADLSGVSHSKTGKGSELCLSYVLSQVALT